jgi:1A family penicillin-binding protein
MKKKSGVIYYLFKEAFWGTINALIMIVAGVGIAGFLIYKYKTPAVDYLSKAKAHETSIIYDRTGTKILYEIHGEENRKILAHDQIPEIIRLSTIAAEDKLFYSHPGIDVFSIIRALGINIEKGGVLQGGSTITQQLARNVFLTREKTITRKFIESIIAIKIERSFTKDQIMDLYLNQVPYGSNAYGIESASEIFFKKDAKDLTISEAALIAALPKAPTYYSPYGNHRNELAKRQTDILKKMRKLNLISQEDYEAARGTNVLSEIAPFNQPIIAPHFVFYVIENLEKEYGKEFLETGGLKIVTTIDLNLQNKAEEIVRQGVLANQSRGATNGCLIALDPKSGQILAMVGSKNYFDESIDGQVNVTLQPRQPGSAIKPVIYATAFERGFQPETLIADEPTNFGPDGSGGDYIPRNYDGKFHGVLPMRKTLAMSLNVPAVKTLQLVGLDNAIGMAHRLGITTFNDRKRYGLSLAIGGAEVRPIDLTAAFSVFANDGFRNTPHGVSEIINSRGEKKYFEKNGGEQVIDPQVARKIDSILTDNPARTPIFGPNSPVYVPGKPVAAKTGTTQDFKDAWTVGFTPNIAVGVWVGNNNGKNMISGSDGIFVAAPVWRKFMDSLPQSYFSGSFIGYDPVEIKNSLALDGSEKDNGGKDKSDKKDQKKKKNKG